MVDARKTLLQKFRRSRGLTIGRLAAIAAVDPSHLGKLEVNKMRLGQCLGVRLCEALGVPSELASRLQDVVTDDAPIDLAPKGSSQRKK
jgi:plasmid maintenance system antidote protein VapI